MRFITAETLSRSRGLYLCRIRLRTRDVRVHTYTYSARGLYLRRATVYPSSRSPVSLVGFATAVRTVCVAQYNVERLPLEEWVQQVVEDRHQGWRETSTTYPPGLHSLMHLDRVFVDHEPDGLEVLRTWDTERRYRVTDVAGTPLYTAIQESAPMARCCLGNCHAWDLHILDAKMQPASVPGGPPTRHREVLRVRRAMRCASCCFPCCLQKVTVHATGGELLGSVTQNWNAWRPSFTVRDAADVPVLLVKGPICRRCGGELDFLIKSIDKQHSVGVITKKWSGTAREFFGDGHSLGLGFPADLDAKIKAVLLGACFLVDFVYFEDQSSTKRNGKPRF